MAPNEVPLRTFEKRIRAGGGGVPIRVGIVGCGAVARRAHVPAWLDHPSAALVALCDPVPEASRTIAARFGLSCPMYESLEALLETSRPDVLDICSPGFLHVEQTRRALEAGCHVLVEKPPAPGPEQAEELARLARSRGLKLGAVFNYRYRDLVMRLKEAIEKGAVGAPVKVYITHHGPVVFTDAPWLWDERRSKYLVWEFGIHFIDVLVHLLGPHERLVHVLPIEQLSLGHTTDLEVTVSFANGALGRLEITQDTTRHSSFFTQVNLYGTAADAFVRWFPPSFRLVAGQVSPLKLVWEEVASVSSVAVKLLRGTHRRDRNISHHRLIAAYADWILGRANYPLTFEAVLPTLRLLAEIEREVPTYRAASSAAASRS